MQVYGTVVSSLVFNVGGNQLPAVINGELINQHFGGHAPSLIASYPLSIFSIQTSKIGTGARLLAPSTTNIFPSIVSVLSPSQSVQIYSWSTTIYSVRRLLHFEFNSFKATPAGSVDRDYPLIYYPLDYVSLPAEIQQWNSSMRWTCASPGKCLRCVKWEGNVCIHCTNTIDNSPCQHSQLYASCKERKMYKMLGAGRLTTVCEMRQN